MIDYDNFWGQEFGQTYNKIADENLHDLGPQASAILEGLLQSPDQEMTQRSADKGSIGGHLGDARCEVVAVLVAVLGQPRGDQLLGTGKCASGKHLGAQRVVLKLLDVGLENNSIGQPHMPILGLCLAPLGTQRGVWMSPTMTYSEITLGPSILSTTRHGRTDDGRDRVLAASSGKLSSRGLSNGRGSSSNEAFGDDLVGSVADGAGSTVDNGFVDIPLDLE